MQMPRKLSEIHFHTYFLVLLTGNRLLSDGWLLLGIEFAWLQINTHLIASWVQLNNFLLDET
jgi:hypothetical protein